MIYIASNKVRHPVTKSLNIICSSAVFWLTVWPTANHKDYNFALYKSYLLYKETFKYAVTMNILNCTYTIFYTQLISTADLITGYEIL
jgi:hypothetical protein